MPFQPTDLSGCFAWYKSTAITGILNGGAALTWMDMSGSGNDLTNAVGTPTYNTNVINGYPTVRFDGASYLGTPTNNDSLNFTAGDITLFSVFSTTGFIANQTVCALDHPSIQAVGGNSFIEGLNFDYNSLSGFYW